MPDIFGADIAGKILAGLGPMVFDYTFVKVIEGTRNPADPTAGTNPTTANHAVKGFMATYRDHQIDGTVIQRGDRKGSLLGASFPAGVVPEPNDKVTAEGQTWYIINVQRDPAGAVYACQLRLA